MPNKKSVGDIRTSSTGWMIKSLGSRLDNAMNQRLKSLGITTDQFAMMMTLLEQDGLTQSQIGEKIKMPGYATTRNLDKLEADGFISREVHESSRRSHCIRVTGKGKKLAPKLFKVVSSVNQELLSNIDESEAIVFNDSLIKLLSAYNK